MKTNCNYCEGDVDERRNLVNGEDDGDVYIDGDGKLTLQTLTGLTYDVQSNYCPMCGRTLKD